MAQRTNYTAGFQMKVVAFAKTRVTEVQEENTIFQYNYGISEYGISEYGSSEYGIN